MPFADPPEKPMVIIQISAVVTGQYPYQRETIYGLGDDNKVYVWHEYGAEWILHKEEK